MKIDIAIRNFASFLNESWSITSKLLQNKNNENSINDWLQANWELLIEQNVLATNEYLEIYGEGADLHGASSRMTDPSALPTHRIVLKSKHDPDVFDILNNERIYLENLTFDKIVGFKNGFYVYEPEFKYLLVTDSAGSERVISLDDVEFELEKM